jgi:DNA polymerase-3 subunit delta'
MYKHNKIIINSDIQIAIEKLIGKLKSNNYVIINPDSFLIEDAKNAIKESYISSQDTKYIILASVQFNIYAQNALLKILEEPPRNIIFILISNNKNIFLPTVRSRVSVEFWEHETLDINLGIDIKNKNIQQFYTLFEKFKNLPKEDGRKIVEVLFLKAIEENISFDKKSMELFSNSIKLINQNVRINFVLANIFSMLLSKQYDNI